MRAQAVVGGGIAPEDSSLQKDVVAVPLLGLLRFNGSRETHCAYLLTSLKPTAL